MLKNTGVFGLGKDNVEFDGGIQCVIIENTDERNSQGRTSGFLGKSFCLSDFFYLKII